MIDVVATHVCSGVCTHLCRLAKGDAALDYRLETHPEFVHKDHPELFEYDKNQYLCACSARVHGRALSHASALRLWRGGGPPAVGTRRKISL